MQVETIAIGDVHEDPANVRLHPERNVAAIKASLARFGQQKPLIIDAQGVVRAGNGTLRAARELGWEHIKCVRTKLTGSEITAYALADNRTAETSEWDYEGLAATLKALQAESVDVASLGWQDFELEPLLAADWTPPAIEPLPEVGSSAHAEAQAKPVEVTNAERAVIEQAVTAWRAAGDDRAKVPLGAALAAICGEYVHDRSAAGMESGHAVS